MAKPRAVLVTGAPGSGKSTLARELALRLRLPFIARDDIRGGLFFSAGAWGDELDRVPPGDEAVEVFLSTVEDLLASGVSCIIEYVVRRGRPQDLDRITAVGDCVVIMTSCADPMERVRERSLADPLLANEAVLNAVGFRSVEELTESVLARMRTVREEMLLDFPLPTLEVDTTSRYVPNVDEAITFITAID
jgi:predicted kinase